MSELLNNSIEKKSRLLHECNKMELLIFNNRGEIHRILRKYDIPVYLHKYIEKNFSDINSKIKDFSANQVFFYKNDLLMTFIVLPLFENDSFIGSVVSGPFLSDTNFKKTLKQLADENNLPGSSQIVLNNYYQSLTILSEQERNNIGKLMLNIFSHVLLDIQNIHLDTEGDLTDIVKTETYEDLYQATKEQYDFEEQLLAAVEQGQLEEALKLKSQRSFPIQDVSYLHNSFRNGQILLDTINTLYCRSVIKGGVPISYADSMSSKFITLIEKASSLDDLKKVSRKMTIDYCECVKRFAITGYTSVIRHAMDYIQQVLSEKIGLKEVALHLKINASYLSTYFKEETGKTLTDYIQNERIKKACYLIDHESDSITDIAMIVGYDDPNYFTRIFKKHTGMTPSEYRQK